VSDVFRCDYCGLYKPLKRAELAYVFDYETTHNCDAHQGCGGDCRDAIDHVYTVSITCSPHCAEMSLGATRVGGR
jgi:hypothetical protein